VTWPIVTDNVSHVSDNKLGASEVAHTMERGAEAVGFPAMRLCGEGGLAANTPSLGDEEVERNSGTESTEGRSVGEAAPAQTRSTAGPPTTSLKRQWQARCDARHSL